MWCSHCNKWQYSALLAAPNILSVGWSVLWWWGAICWLLSKEDSMLVSSLFKEQSCYAFTPQLPNKKKKERIVRSRDIFYWGSQTITPHPRPSPTPAFGWVTFPHLPVNTWWPGPRSARSIVPCYNNVFPSAAEFFLITFYHLLIMLK